MRLRSAIVLGVPGVAAAAAPVGAPAGAAAALAGDLPFAFFSFICFFRSANAALWIATKRRQTLGC
jgi:hypothetical protein